MLGPLAAEGVAGLGPRDRVVQSVLVLRRWHSCDAETLIDTLWGEAPPASATKVVQGCVSRLRRVLGADAILTSSTGYRLSERVVEIDVDELEEAVDRARRDVESGMPERAVVAFDVALALWRGPPLPDLEDWQPGQLEAARLAELRRTVQEERLDALLASGRHRQVATEATVLAGEEPWRERRWVQLALAQYRCGRQADALATIRRARRNLGESLGLDLGADLVSLESAVLGQDPALSVEARAESAGGRCPWRGLAPYGQQDREDFFGRSGEIAECRARLQRFSLLVIAGPSGSGKSSLLRAGLGPELERHGFRVVTFTPGRDPDASLAASLATARSRDPVVCVDQLEEVFTAGLDQARIAAWLHQLLDYAERCAPVVVTVRADHLPSFAVDTEVARTVEQGLYLIAPLSGDALREAIEAPARSAGLRLEPGLVDLLLRDAEDQPGALPLLSHALAETWQRREGPVLSIEGYHATGGLSGAVAASADRLHEGLNEAQRARLRWLMLRMADLGEHGEPVRTPLPREVATADTDGEVLVDLLVRTRLVTADRAQVELAHEALVRAWPRLRGWLEEDRAGQRVSRHLASAAADWDALGRPETELYSGVRLDAAQEWVRRAEVPPARLEVEFLAASADHAEAERVELARQAGRERAQNRRLRGLLAGGVVMLVVALVAGALALDGSHDARAERDAARHESLVGESLGARTTNRSLAALLAVESYRQRPDAAARSALLGTFTQTPGFLGSSRLAGGQSVFATALPSGSRAVIAAGSQLRVFDLRTGEQSAPFDNPLPGNRNYAVVRASADGSRVAELIFDPEDPTQCGYYEALLRDDGRGCSSVMVWDVRTGKLLLGPVVTPINGGDVALNRDGSILAVAGGYDGDVVTWDVESGRRLGRRAGLPRPDGVYLMRDTGTVAFAGRDRLFLGSMAGPVRELDARTLRVRDDLRAPLLSANQYLVVAGDLLVAVGDQHLAAFDLRTGSRRWLVSLADTYSSEPCPYFAVSTRMRHLYCGNYFGQLEERNLDDGQRTGTTFDSQLGEVGDLVVADRGRELAAFSQGSPYVLRWRLDGGGPLARMVAPGQVAVGGYDPSGRYLLARAQSGSAQRVLTAESGRTVLRLPGDEASTWVSAGVLARYGRPDRGHDGLLDVTTGRLRASEALTRRTDLVLAEGDGQHAWAVEEDPSALVPSLLRRFDVRTGRETGDRLEVEGWPETLSVSPDDTRLVITAGSSTWRTTVFDAADYHMVTSGLPDDGRTAYGARGTFLGADYHGGMTQFDPETLEPVVDWAGSRGQVSSMEFSADGRLLLQVGYDQTLQLFDVATRTRLGDAVVAGAVDGERSGWLRPDGQALLVNDRAGIVEWTLDPDRMTAAACRLAGRDLTATEWTTYLGYQEHHDICPE